MPYPIATSGITDRIRIDRGRTDRRASDFRRASRCWDLAATEPSTSVDTVRVTAPGNHDRPGPGRKGPGGTELFARSRPARGGPAGRTPARGWRAAAPPTRGA